MTQEASRPIQASPPVEADLILCIGEEGPTFSSIIGELLLKDGTIVPSSRGETPSFEMHDNFLDIARGLRKYDGSDKTAVGIFPVKNSVVRQPEDVLGIFLRDEFLVLKEAWLRINLMLAGTANSSIDDVESVMSIPTVLKQAYDFVMEEHDFIPVNADNTSAAAKAVAEAEDDSVAAICSRQAVKYFKLSILAENIEDDPNNETLFYIVRNHKRQPEPQSSVLKKQFDKDEAAIVVGIGTSMRNHAEQSMESYVENAGAKYEVIVRGTQDKHFFELSGTAGRLLDILSRRRKFIDLELLGIFPPGKHYEEE